ncbi:MAG TPA: MBL fold metallo-hydrolase [Terriglobia bacterium]|nr:MBL fold metallo-hydrolase [Terriglobia bacterium]
MKGKLFALALSLAFAAAALAVSPRPQAAGNSPIVTLPVQGNVYMLAGPGGNTTVQIGADGVLVVDTQTDAMAPNVLAAIRKLSDKPVLWVINTDIHPEHTGGNEALPRLAATGTGQRARIIAHQNVLNRMTALPAASRPAQALWPNDEYFLPWKDFSFNGEPVFVYHVDAAHTDGDSIVLFRRSDVVSTGDIFTPGHYPVIDLQNGGGMQGVIDGLNKILQLTVPLKYQEGGTYVIPGRGRICDEADVVEYRDMMTIVRDRIQDMIEKKMTLQQVKAARPTMDYDPEYGSNTGPWTTDMFVEAAFKSLSETKSDR